MAEVYGAIHEQSMKQLKNLQIPQNLMRYIHQDATRYLTYLILNKTKLDSWQARVLPPPSPNKAHLSKE